MRLGHHYSGDTKVKGSIPKVGRTPESSRLQFSTLSFFLVKKLEVNFLERGKLRRKEEY
jgi:hypothetical protein